MHFAGRKVFDSVEPAAGKPLNERERRFVTAVVAGILPTAAARASGYSVRRAAVTASEKMADPRIRTSIDEGIEERRLNNAGLEAAVWAELNAAIQALSVKRLERVLKLADHLGEPMNVQQRERLARRIRYR